MKKGIKKDKTKKKNQTKEKKLNNSNLSEEFEDNDIFISNIKNNNQINDDKKYSNNINNEDSDFDLFEKDLKIMDENYKNRDYFEPNYEPNFSIIYPDKKMNSIPLFTPRQDLMMLFK